MPGGALATRLTPLILDAMIFMLAFTIVSGYVVGWVNLQRLRRREGARVITDTRFGA